MRNLLFLLACTFVWASTSLYAQAQHWASIELSASHVPNGFHLMDTEGKELFLVGESKHNAVLTPALTLQLLKKLHRDANLRVWALEMGPSVAYLLNDYLANQNPKLLKQIVRNTMFWGQEQYQMLQELAQWNLRLPAADRITVESIDVEYKAEAAVLQLHRMLLSKEIPMALKPTLGAFVTLFEENRMHREKYQALMTHFYYDREYMIRLIEDTHAQWKSQPAPFIKLFSNDYKKFSRIIQGLYDGYVKFNYSRPSAKAKRRDNRIYEQFIRLSEEYRGKGVLCIIGSAHTSGDFSGARLYSSKTSPYYGKTVLMEILQPFNHSIPYSRFRKFNREIDGLLLRNSCTLIKHSSSHSLLKPLQPHTSYTFFLNQGNSMTPFANAYYAKE